ncbi:MAG TPA: hypothetical protein VFQ88_04635 [Nevskiaceae bacterium]|nr:hypothetical protein [Nevskiaceae bacterium]
MSALSEDRDNAVARAFNALDEIQRALRLIGVLAEITKDSTVPGNNGTTDVDHLDAIFRIRELADAIHWLSAHGHGIAAATGEDLSRLQEAELTPASTCVDQPSGGAK